jgi:hypothetical protein
MLQEIEQMSNFAQTLDSERFSADKESEPEKLGITKKGCKQ